MEDPKHHVSLLPLSLTCQRIPVWNAVLGLQAGLTACDADVLAKKYLSACICCEFVFHQFTVVYTFSVGTSNIIDQVWIFFAKSHSSCACLCKILLGSPDRILDTLYKWRIRIMVLCKLILFSESRNTNIVKSDWYSDIGYIVYILGEFKVYQKKKVREEDFFFSQLPSRALFYLNNM